MVILSVLGSGPIVSVFTKDPETFQLASTGFRIFAVTLFLVICLVSFPYFLGITGVWLAVPAAEILTRILSGYMHWKYFFKKDNRIYF